MESTHHDQPNGEGHDEWHDVTPEMGDSGNPSEASSNGGEPDDAGSATGGARTAGATASATAQAWLGQLQTIIDNLATQSAPVIREVGAKAAELAAVAADKTGPFAQRAADATQSVSARVAERSRELAAELRRGPEGAPGGGTGLAGAADSTEFRMAEDDMPQPGQGGSTTEGNKDGDTGQG